MTVLSWVHLNGQSIDSKSVLYQQNKIEIVLDVSCNISQVNQTKILDTLLVFSQRAVVQLEKNLIYKMSNRIKFIVFDEIESFEKYQNLATSRIETSHLHPSVFLNIYTPIYIGTSIHQIEYQVKKGASIQFIEEYLYGLSYREKLDGIQHSPIPPWITRGFVEYFSGGIQVSDFQEFIINSKKGFFKNINYIPESVQSNFGCVIWYMFEKEKGRSFNSAFWYLIKYANSFQGSFEYQFGLKFKKWLRDKIVEIESKYKLESFKSDFSTNFLSKTPHFLHQMIEFNENQTNVIYTNVYNFENQYLFKHIEQKNILVYQSNSIANSHKSTFNRFEIVYIPVNSSSNLNGIMMLHFHEGQWRISKILAPNSFKLIQVLGKSGTYRNLKCTENGYSMIYEAYGQSEILKFDFDLNRNSDSKFEQSYIFDYLWDEKQHNQYFLVSTTNKYNKNHSMLIRQSLLGIKDTLYDDSSHIGSLKLENLIIESENHLSFVKSGENQQQVIHLFYVQGNWIVKTLETKGYFYQQFNGFGSNEINAIYQSSQAFMMNKFQKDEVIYAQDTFVRKIFSFDTLKATFPEISSNTTYDSSNGYFISPYKVIPMKVKSSHSINKSLFSVPLKSAFLNSFFTTRSRLYFSNEEIDLPYRTTIPLNSLFNSIGTLYFKHKILSDNKMHQFSSAAFSTVDRNRYGLTFEHNYQKYKTQLHSIFVQFRSRQFKQIYGDLFENKVALLGYALTTRNQYFNSSIKYAYQLQSDIDLNTNENATLNTNIYHHINEIDLSISPRKSFNKRGWVANGFLRIILSSSKSEDSFKNLSRLNVTGKLNYIGKHIEFKSTLNANYSLFNDNFYYIIGGSNGSLISQQYDNVTMSQLKVNKPVLMQHNGYVRGFFVGSRVGSSSFVLQNEVLVSPLNLFPSRVIESNFWKKLFFVAFLDFGTAFNGKTPGDLSNPFNSKIYQTNTYTLTVNAERDAYLLGLGFGINFNIWGYDFRVERAFGYNENSLQNKLFHFCVGKNF